MSATLDKVIRIAITMLGCAALGYASSQDAANAVFAACGTYLICHFTP